MKRLAMAVVASALSSAVMAEEAAESKFETTLSAGATVNKGNSESTQLNASLITVGEKELVGSIRAGIEANYGQSEVDDEKETSTDNLKIFMNVKKDFTEMDSMYLDASYFTDNVAEVDYRLTIGPGYSRYFIKNDTKKLNAEIGPSYVWESVAGESDHFAALRVAERFDCKLSDSANLWQSAEILPKIEDFGYYLVNFEIGVESELTETLNLRLVLQDKYSSEPGEGNKKNDLTFIAGISLKL